MARLLVAGVLFATLATTTARADAFDMGPGDAQTGVDGSDQGASAPDVVPDLTEGGSGLQLSVPEPGYGVWDRLANCEAGGDWHSAGNPIYKGGLQFDAQTWARHGGLEFAWRADFASRAEQIIVGQRTQAAQGWRAWPTCARLLGLR